MPIRKTDNLSLLAQVPLFEGLSKAQLRIVGAHLREETYSSGQNIVVEGGKGGGFFLILEGRAEVLVGARAKRNLGPGDFFGEMSLFDGLPRSGTVRATSYVRAVAMTSWNFMAMLEENFGITKKMLSDLSRRVRESNREPEP